MRSTHGAWALALSLVLAPAVASATITEALSLEQLVQHADTVALVTCVDHRASYDSRQRIVTDYTLRIEEVMKGRASVGATVEMRRLGGVIGDLGMRVEGEPYLEEGQRYLVFLRHTDAGPHRPVGMSQGVMSVSEDGGVLTVQPGGGGLSLVQRGADGRLHPAPAALLHEAQLEQLRERVETIRRQQSTGGTVRP